MPFRPGSSLLDLGTGDGGFTERVARRVGARRVVGVEMVTEVAEEARARGVDVVEHDLERGLPFDDGEFDVIHANQIIEHLRGTDLFLAEIARVLAPDGLACISTNNLASWHNIGSLVMGLQPMAAHVSDDVIVGNRLNPEHGDRHEDGRSHLRTFTAKALDDLSRHHGLEPLELRTVGMYPLPPRVARLALRVDPGHGAFLVGVFAKSKRA